ncbi:MAG: cation diffusion facilitator family transporter [Loigolactobacillus coryniformis]|uniref:Formate dehydrogenase family accessory protein FdhD n=2 Tax=Loigolactobacillus coryniformis subsp. coryniformis TaxID=115541 RepID=J3EQU3_9LACO|nr:cation diffusion facilitator family transporter [Loigolactobacillus coryniformis]OEH90458.1 cation transporter [Loigolactobacillus coryniformis subsp. coryniformis]ATO54468.1 cation transporter [Loigolactobacillus coryniformis subsp. coryniformis KCTC 3167 = DSM 20001]EJN55840.1 Formate dehydrogenase family accessory protein FdhD [Loigolactobacillus coryniformis subsp. coryniformis CECT 5711]KRK14509.1 cation efflux protein [Loigolactobacillus coryniformis subsp. coryniformis KCTC 3167 = DSM
MTITEKQTPFVIGVNLNLIYIVAELGFGFSTNSMALIADASHNFSDVLGLLVAWLAVWLSQKAPTAKRTYGYKSASILAALFNAVFLLIAIGGIITEAIQRLNQPATPHGWTVISVALLGVIVNGVTTFLFVHGQKEDLNIKGAFMHMAADTGVSLGVVVTGFIMLATDWTWLDPVVSLVIAVIILIGTWGLLRGAINLALNGVPNNVDLAAITKCIASQPSVSKVHDLHVWAIGTSDNALSVHLVRDTTENNDCFLNDLDQQLRTHYNIQHITIQVEYGDCQQLGNVENSI